MKRIKHFHFIMAMIVAIFLISCKSEESEWAKVKQSDKITEIEVFIKNYPEGIHLKEAQSLIAEINKTNELKETQKANTIEAYDSFIKKYNDSSKQNIEAQKSLNDLLIKTLVPDCVFLCGLPKEPLLGVWFGQLSFTIGNNFLGFAPPDPKVKKVIVVVLSNKNLKPKLENGKAYYWRGKNEFLFIKDIDMKKELKDIPGEVGLKNLGATELGKVDILNQ